MNNPDQEKVWDSISEPWKNFRVKPVDEVLNFLKNKEGNILDLGCGAGRNFMKVNGIIYGVDFSEKMLKFAKEYSNKERFNVKLIKARTNNLPFNDNFFDAAIFVAVLHCIPPRENREKSLKELFRVLKSGSEALITVWDRNQQKFFGSKKEAMISWKYNGKEYLRYYYLYDKGELTKLLKKVGFEIVKINDSENPNGLYSKKNIDVIVKKP
ncbi:MAG: class I SAM-dependent methyltransferase [Candidatus Nanoarchaeia archaeon]